MNILEQTPKQSVIFEDTKVLVALAFKPLTKGHSVVIWKDGGEDINKLKTEDYEYLMKVSVSKRKLMDRELRPLSNVTDEEIKNHYYTSQEFLEKEIKFQIGTLLRHPFYRSAECRHQANTSMAVGSLNF